MRPVPLPPACPTIFTCRFHVPVSPVQELASALQGSRSTLRLRGELQNFRRQKAFERRHRESGHSKPWQLLVLATLLYSLLARIHALPSLGFHLDGATSFDASSDRNASKGLNKSAEIV